MCCLVSQVIDLVDTLPMENQYEYFKMKLLDIHQLSDYEKFNMLSKMKPMGEENQTSSSTQCWSTARWGRRSTSFSTTSSRRDVPRP